MSALRTALDGLRVPFGRLSSADRIRLGKSNAPHDFVVDMDKYVVRNDLRSRVTFLLCVVVCCSVGRLLLVAMTFWWEEAEHVRMAHHGA